MAASARLVNLIGNAAQAMQGLVSELSEGAAALQRNQVGKA
ncbi:hypothetical protein [Caenimonas sp. SL110]|nr:hypothetical protein [Caenimonas sp. SL110]